MATKQQALQIEILPEQRVPYLQFTRVTQTLENLGIQVHTGATHCKYGGMEQQRHSEKAAVCYELCKGMSDATVHPIASQIALEATNMTTSLLTDTGYEYSPLMLTNGVSRIMRLIFMVFCSAIGSTMNGYFVASFFVEATLRQIGYTYMACIGVADLMLTSVVMPTSGVVLMSGEWDTVNICRVMQIIGQTATYAYSLFFMMTGMESYFRICGTTSAYKRFLSIKVAYISLLIWWLSVALSVGGALLEYDYDYCERKFYGNTTFRIATMVLFHGIPAGVTYATLAASKKTIEQRANAFKRTNVYRREYSITTLNIAVYAIFIASWLPCVIVVYKYPDLDRAYYFSVWVGLFRSVFTSLLYGISNRPFRRAFGRVFNYCCFKNTLPSPRRNRRTRYHTRSHQPLERKRATGPVRAHALQVLGSGYPHDSAATTSEITEL